MLKLSDFTYQGIELGDGIDLSGKEHLRLDVWQAGPESGGSLDVVLVTEGGEKGQSVTVESNQVEPDRDRPAALHWTGSVEGDGPEVCRDQLDEIYIDNLAATGIYRPWSLSTTTRPRSPTLI